MKVKAKQKPRKGKVTKSKEKPEGSDSTLDPSEPGPKKKQTRKRINEAKESELEGASLESVSTKKPRAKKASKLKAIEDNPDGTVEGSGEGSLTKVSKSTNKRKKTANASTDPDSTLPPDLESSPKKRAGRRRKIASEEAEADADPANGTMKYPRKTRKRIVSRRIVIDSSSDDDEVAETNEENQPIVNESSTVADSSQTDQNSPTATPSIDPDAANSANPIDSLLKSPLGQISLEQGGITVVEDPNAPTHTPSFLVPPAVAEANPAIAQATPGSLVLVSQSNPDDPTNQLVHVYRISAPESGPSS